MVEEPTPLLCCRVLKFFRKEGPLSSESTLQLVEEFSHYVGLSCDGHVGKLSALFADIIANNEEKGAVAVASHIA